MIVNRTTDQQGPATLTLYFRESSSEAAPSPAGSQLSSASDGRSKAPPPLENERVATIDMKHKHSSAILEEFLKKTGAVPVMPTPQDEAELREIKELEERANYDRARVKKKVDAAKKEAQLLAQARNEVAAMKTAA